MRLLRRLAVLALLLALLLGVSALSRPRVRVTHPAAAFRNAAASSLTWWVVNTPLCAGPLCVNIFDDHANLEWHWAG